MDNHKIYTNEETLTQIPHLTCATLYSTADVLFNIERVYNLSRPVG